MRIEFQERESPHVHAFAWILDALKISYKTEYKSLAERTISTLLADPGRESELFELIKYKKLNSGFRMGVSFQIEL